LGITGIVIGALGGFMTVASVASSDAAGPDSSTDDGAARAGIFFLGLVGLFGGSGLALGGFSLAANNRSPSMDLQPMPSMAPSPAARAGISFGGKF
jgi:hypothetical protein